MSIDWWQVAFIAVLVGGMWSSYRIGFKEGTGAMIDFCKKKSDSMGMVSIRFIGEHIEFIDSLSYNKAMLEKIVEEIEKQSDDDSREI